MAHLPLSCAVPLAYRGMALLLAFATLAVSSVPARAHAGNAGATFEARQSAAKAMGALGGITRVSAGGRHTCALSAAGGVKCWGENFYGQLGDGSETHRPAPVDVTGLTSGIAAISSGGSHTCALTTAGGVKCWGSNSVGQLGNDPIFTPYSLVPIDVTGLTNGVAAISAGDRHTCALSAAGGVKCWGENFYGQLGDGSNTYRPVPVDVTGLTSGVAAISAGYRHTCALTTVGGVKCWGYNIDGQLGDNSRTSRLTPTDVAGLTSGGASISAGAFHTCARTAAGGVKCWGANYSGQLGDNSGTLRLTPVDVTGLTSGVAAILASYWHSCALTTAGGVKCWGLNSGGRLGDSSTTNRLTPVDVTGLTNGVAAITSAYEHTCVLMTTAGVKCWGDNLFGQLGNNSIGYRMTPADVTGLSSGLAAISAGGAHSCVMTTGGGVKCWGYNFAGQLGDNSTADRLTAVDATGLANGMTAISLGQYHTCALTPAGGVKCWGYNDRGELGDNSRTSRLTPIDVTGLTNGVAAVSARGNQFASHTCALTTSGGVKCWGANHSGQLGDNSTTYRLMPVDVTGLASGVAAVSAGGSHTCALTTAGGVKCWGLNSSYQLGNGSVFTGRSLTPVDVTGLASGVVAITAGDVHTCALLTTGGVRCWDENRLGQLGDYPASNGNVTGLASGVAAISAGDAHTCALTTAGGMKCWGSNFYGQLGDNSTDTRLAPVNVTGLTSGVSSISAGGGHTCARTSAGGAKCWGYKGFGQLGDGTASVSLVPVTVVDGVISTPILSANPESLDFGGQSMNTTAPVRAITLTNGGTGTVTVSAITVSTHFAVTHNCATLAVGASCGASVGFTPTAQGSLDGTLTITAGTGVQTISLAGIGERSLVTHYYRAILNRAPDASGKAFWEAEFARLGALGSNPNESWFLMANYFFNSPEYISAGKTNTAFMIDVYNTFFNRPPDQGGFDFWMSQMNAGLSREGVIFWFMFSNEFRTFTQGIFGSTSARAEVDLVMDFFRGILNRFPDTAAFNAFVGNLRSAQCQAPAARAGAVYTTVNDLSYFFLFTAPEYAGRARTNTQFVSDMYNAFLRRGGTASEMAFWINQLNTGAKDRNRVRVDFIASPEFGARVSAIIAQGCVS